MHTNSCLDARPVVRFFATLDDENDAGTLQRAAPGLGDPGGRPRQPKSCAGQFSSAPSLIHRTTFPIDSAVSGASGSGGMRRWWVGSWQGSSVDGAIFVTR